MEATQVQQQQQFPAQLYESIQDFLQNKYGTISNEQLLDEETWLVYRGEYECLTEFRTNLDSQKRAVCDSIDTTIEDVTRILSELRSGICRRIDDMFQPFHVEYTQFKQDVNQFCDRARAILIEERARLVAEVRTSIKDSWTAQSLREEFTIVDRHCEAADVNRATSIIVGVRDASNILQNARRIYTLQRECALALNSGGLQETLQSFTQSTAQLALNLPDHWIKAPFPEHPRIAPLEVEIQELLEAAAQNVVTRTEGTQATHIDGPQVTTTAPAERYITQERQVVREQTEVVQEPRLVRQSVPAQAYSHQVQYQSPARVVTPTREVVSPTQVSQQRSFTHTPYETYA